MNATTMGPGRDSVSAMHVDATTMGPGRVIFFPINDPGMGRFQLFDLVGYS